MQAKLTLKMDKDIIIDSDVSFLEFNKVSSKSNTNNVFLQAPCIGVYPTFDESTLPKAMSD